MGDAVGGRGSQAGYPPRPEQQDLGGKICIQATPFNIQQQTSRLKDNLELSSISTMVRWVVLPLHEELFENISSFSWVEIHCLILQGKETSRCSL